MTKDERDKLREVATGATPGPWDWRNSSDLRTLHDRGEYRYGEIVLCRCRNDDGDPDIEVSEADRCFIAAAHPQAVLALLDELEAARALLWEMQWIPHDEGRDFCRICNVDEPKHDPTCRLWKMLGES